MNKSELVLKINEKHSNLSHGQVIELVNNIIQQMKQSIAEHKRIEIRNFGSFYIQPIKARSGRNPKTGEKIYIKSKFNPRFKAGKNLKNKINADNS